MKNIMFGIIFILVVTGCSNGALNGELTNNCNKVEVASGFTEDLNYQLDFKENVISKITLTKHYHATTKLAEASVLAVKTTLSSEDQYWANKAGVQITTTIDQQQEYARVYEFDLTKMTNDLLDHFELSNNRTSQVNKLKEKGFVCK